jgi:hypothetical protein
MGYQGIQSRKIERIIWMYWDQGLEQAPELVRACHESWLKNNPGWKVILLDSGDVNQYLSEDASWFDLKNLCLAHKSDLLRLYLLKEFGGVWADATTFCMRPLDQWIDAAAGSGFFCFDRAGRDRPIANWFIAAEPDNYLVNTLFVNLVDYFSDNSFGPVTPFKRWMLKRLGKRFNRSISTTEAWFSWWVRRGLGLCPYFIFHYMFSRLLFSDSRFKAIWGGAVKISADGPHSLQKIGLLNAMPDSCKRQIDSCEVYIYKLDWRKSLPDAPSGSVLDYICNSYG